MKTLLTTIAILAVAASASAQQPARGGGRGRGGPQPQAIQMVKPGLYMVTGAGGNSTFRVTSEGIILVDGKLPGEENYNALMALIKGVSDKPIKYLIVTHHHADHTGNNQRFLDAGVQVVAHENLNKNLVTYAQDPKPASASLTYPGAEYTLKLGGTTVELHHFGRAHTSGDTVVYFPDLKTVCLSDTVTTGRTDPLIDYAGGGSATDWTNVLAGVLKLDFDAAVPGNGDVLTKADVAAYKAKFDAMIAHARELVDRKVPQDQLLAQLKTDIGWAPRIPKVDAFVAELSAGK
ncbi:MAG TPA: MBL fold metallo-hydrolase [Bryobacteraceae bacterium]|jgi:glyoxylase-like metal-dependent hydrolase (beta-lactamase superfamily II)|nr:MBL fold metallo-hydrolase [Bryobacteraceae bacterium]